MSDADEATLSRIGVVVVAFRSRPTVLEALGSLPLGSLAATVVVDNGDDGTGEVVAAAGLPRVAVTARPDNPGFGAGVMAGLALLPPDADLVLLLNPDAALPRGDLLALARHLDAEQRCGLVAPRLLRGAVPQHSAGRLATLWTELRFVLPPPLARRVPDRRFDPDHDVTGKVPVVEGAVMLVRRSALLAVGGFDPGQFLYFEEHHLARLLRREGLEVHLVAEARAQHVGGVSTAGLAEAGRVEYVRATVRYLRQHEGALAAAAYRAVARASIRLRTASGGLAPAQGRALRSGLRRRPAPVFLSWMRYHGRTEALAAALGATPAYLGVGRLGHRRSAPWRYLVQSARTLAHLARHRPRALLVQAPPDLLVRLCLAYARLTRAVVVVDAHSAAVAAVRGGAPRASFRRLARRCTAVVVTNRALSEELPGARVIELDDPPEPERRSTTATRSEGNPRVVFPAGWADDEPWRAVVAAASLLPDVDLVLTGRAPGHVSQAAASWPPNVALAGFLALPEFHALVADADVVLALTTREATMQRAAYEAVAHGKRLVASGTQVLRAYLGEAAVYTDPTPEGIAEAVREALARPVPSAELQRVRDRHELAFRAGLEQLRALLAERP